MSDLLFLLTEARRVILTVPCRHPVTCADEACRKAGHDHENYGEDGWGCEHGCPCVPACEGHEPDTCAKTTRAREVVERLDAAIAYENLRASHPVSDPAPEARQPDPWPCHCRDTFHGNGTGRGCPRCAPTNPESPR